MKSTTKNLFKKICATLTLERWHDYKGEREKMSNTDIRVPSSNFVDGTTPLNASNMNFLLEGVRQSRRIIPRNTTISNTTSAADTAGVRINDSVLVTASSVAIGGVIRAIGDLVIRTGNTTWAASGNIRGATGAPGAGGGGGDVKVAFSGGLLRIGGNGTYQRDNLIIVRNSNFDHAYNPNQFSRIIVTSNIHNGVTVDNFSQGIRGNLIFVTSNGHSGQIVSSAGVIQSC